MATVAESLRNLGAIRIVAVVAAALALLVILFFLSMRLTSPVMSVLYSEVPVEDGAKIVTQLEGQGVKYELRAGGTQILVPSDKVLNLRMTMAGEGLPSRGSIVGYEIFDKSDSLGTSNFVYNVNLIRALEGELSRTIASFNKVDTARVHLVIPKRELFVKDKTEPSASVILKIKGNRTIEKHEVLAIGNFIASAVPGLKPGRVTIVDNNGTLLSRGGDDGDYSMIASTNQEYKANYEKKLKSTVEEILEKSVGLGKVEAQVSVDMDFDRLITNSETYDPDSQVARSTQTVEEKDQSSDRQNDVSVANNLPDAKLNSGTAGSFNNAEKTDETKNFEISKTVTNLIKEPGAVKKISVAVLVDGTYTTEKDAEGKEKSNYSPRSPEELDKLKSLVKSSIGFDEKRGDSIEMVNMQFTREIDFAQTEAAFDWLKRDFDSILKTLVIGVVAVLVILLVIKPLVNRAFEISPGDTGDQITPPAMATGGGESRAPSDVSEALGGIDIDKISNRVVTSSIKKISTVVETNPEETLAVIREWLNQR